MFFFPLLFHGEAKKLADTLFKPLSAALRAQIQQITMLYPLKKKVDLSYMHKEAYYNFSETNLGEETSTLIFLF